MNLARNATAKATLAAAVQEVSASLLEGEPFAEFSDWLDEQLEALERRFWTYSTYNSLRRASSR